MFSNYSQRRLFVTAGGGRIYPHAIGLGSENIYQNSPLHSAGSETTPSTSSPHFPRPLPEFKYAYQINNKCENLYPSHNSEVHRGLRSSHEAMPETLLRKSPLVQTRRTRGRIKPSRGKACNVSDSRNSRT